MGWICRCCGSENPYIVTECPVCENKLPSETDFLRERSMEKMDKALYLLPKRIENCLHCNRYLTMFLVLLVIAAGVYSFQHRSALFRERLVIPDTNRMIRIAEKHLSDYGKAIADARTYGSERVVTRLADLQSNVSVRNRKFVDNRSWRVGTILMQTNRIFTDHLQDFQERTQEVGRLWQSRLQQAVRRLQGLQSTVKIQSEKVNTGFQKKIPVFHQGIESFRSRFSLKAIWKTVVGIFTSGLQHIRGL